jgi:glycosyltransferase involved in cell wall biosynthesis
MRFLVGTQQFLSGVTTDVSSPMVTQTGENIFFLGRRFAFQRRVMLPALRAPVAVVELNPRIVNTWLLLFARRLLRRPTLVWGHAFPRAGADASSDRLRAVVRRLADRVIVYTKRDVETLQSREPELDLRAAPNAIYSKSAMKVQAAEPVNRLVWIGRMVDDKRPLLALRGFAAIPAHVRGDTRLTFVGDGPLLADIRRAVAASAVRDYVDIYGWVTDEEALARVFSEAVGMLATGYVGLNVTQALGFGVPVLYPDREPHAPEVEAINGDNSLVFSARDEMSLATTIERLLTDRTVWLSRRHSISADTREAYSVENMASAFIEACLFRKP